MLSSIVVYKIYHGHGNFVVQVPSDKPHLPFALHVSSQSHWSAQHAPVGPFPIPNPQCPMIHVGVGLGVVVVSVVVDEAVIVVVILPFLHIYESPGT